MDYDSMEDMIGKKLKLTVDLKKATEIPQKYTYVTKCKYDLFEGQERFETEEIKNMKEPEFNHTKEMILDINEDLLAQFRSKTLTFEVYGKIEPKKNSLAAT